MNLLDDIIRRLDALPERERKEVIDTARKATKDMIWVPNPGPQTEAYFSPADWLFYGGSAGGGKSALLLGLAVNEHQFSRIFRRHFKDIDGVGGLAGALQQTLGSWDGYNSQRHTWRLRDREIEFGAFTNAQEAEAYQGRPADFFGFDEITQFQRDLVRFITVWNRTTKTGQRCRVVMAGNPPVTPEGLWVIEDFAPWLDPRHPNPAKPGELRYFTTIDGKEDVEVDADWQAEDRFGKIIRPKSRTFIPASLSDNPDLLDTDYASTLANLPKHLREAFLDGQFRATLEDQDRQVIPTEWILQAQDRWKLRQGELVSKPQTAIGADIADGGPDRMVVVPLHGVVFGEPRIKPGIEVKTTEQKVAMIVSAAKDDPQMNIDCGGGYGGGVSDSLENNGFNVVRCRGAEGSSAMDRSRTRGFANKRAEWVWRFAEGLDPEHGDNMCLPPGREIVAELTAFREKAHPDSRSVIAIEDNDEIKKRLGRSPDIAWGFIFAWAEPDRPRKAQRASIKRRRDVLSATPRVSRQYDKVIGRKG